MAASGQLHAPAAVVLGKNHRNPFNMSLIWPQNCLDSLKMRKIIYFCRDSNHEPSAVEPAARPYTDRAIPEPNVTRPWQHSFEQ